MTFLEAINLSKEISLITDDLSDKLNSFEKSSNGMVLESVRLSDNFRELKSQYNKYFKKEGEINRYINRNFKKLNRDYSMAKRFKKDEEFLSKLK